MDLSSLLFDLDDPPEATRVHRAAYLGDLAALTALDHEGGHVEGLNRRLSLLGATPLRLAVTGDNLSCAHWLLDHGAAVDLTDMKAQTPLFVAVKHQHLECARLLLERGADPNGSEEHLSTPLAQCCQTGWLPGVQLLLAAGAMAEIELVRERRLPQLPLHVAAVHHHLDCFLALLMAGCRADPLRHWPGLAPTAVVLAAADASSVPHALLKHRCGPEFAELLYQFGGDLWQRDALGRRSWEAEPAAGAAANYLKSLAGTPQRLDNLCRLAVRRQLSSCGRLQQLNKLQLPATIVSYLLYGDATGCLVRFGTNRFQ